MQVDLLSIIWQLTASGHWRAGKNERWKQGINLGKRNNQNFAAIPHARFIEMLTYKAELAGIAVKVTEESYISKCSFLDNEPVCKHSEYRGKRIKRGLFRAGDGRLINADVNGSANIVKKVFPNANARGKTGRSSTSRKGNTLQNG